MRYSVLFLVLIATLLFVQDVHAQAGDPDDGGDILMLEEIIIQVAPELPTVVVTIERQKPQLKEVTIQSPLQRMVHHKKSEVKPDLSKMKVSKIKDSDKMLARQRKR